MGYGTYRLNRNDLVRAWQPSQLDKIAGLVHELGGSRVHWCENVDVRYAIWQRWRSRARDAPDVDAVHTQIASSPRYRAMISWPNLYICCVYLLKRYKNITYIEWTLLRKYSDHHDHEVNRTDHPNHGLHQHQLLGMI